MSVEDKAENTNGGFGEWLKDGFWPGLRHQAKRYARLFYFAGREFKRDNCVVRSAALAYVLLLSLVPATFVFFIVLNILGAFSTYGHRLINSIADRIFPGPQFDSAREYLATNTDKLMSQVSGQIAGVSFSVVSLGAMIITAALLLVAVEKAINDIWAVNVKRSILKRLSNIWMIITLGPVLIFFSYYFGLSLYSSVEEELAKQSWLYDTFLFVLPYLLSVVVFYLLFQFVPYTAVRADAALTGAIFSGIVWEFSKVPFTAYVSNVINPTGVYGPLGVIPFFLLWVYFSWVITLFGAELSYCKQNFEMMSSAHKHDEHFLSLYRGYYSIRVLQEAVKSFHGGKGPMKANRVAKKLHVPLNWCRELAEDLRKRDLLSYTGGDSTRFQLAKAPDKITLKEVLGGASGARLEVPANADSPEDRVMREIFSAINTHREETLGAITFSDVLESSAQQG